ncbi:hypothetical protein [Jiangella asiatica]|uniref:hypothetical protein n=1 Tax=Jiangella asiatica TaxID=2530372 RepID=UPI0013A5D7FF|nr:hypothetical protein [Jiangella asiatica]
MHSIAVHPGQSISFRSICPACGGTAEWEHRRGPILFDGRGHPMAGSDTYRIACPTCPA